MKKSLIITIVCFALGVVVLAAGFILLTDNEISKSIFTTTTTTTTKAPAEPAPEYKVYNFYEENISDWITLGDYKGLKVEVEQTKISEADIDMQIHILLCQKDLQSKQLSGNVTQKVIFNFDYTGYLLKDDGTRGEAFEGGTGTNQLAYIDGNDLVTVSSSGLGGFIDGFAQGMIGMSVGEKKSIKITFPDDYSAEMAGKKTEFEVKINYIAKTTFDNATASYISNNTYKTVSEYRQSVRKDLEDALKEQNNQSILLEILNNATVVASVEKQNEYIFGLFCAEVDYYVEMYQAYGISFGDMLKQFGFNSVAELREYSEEYAKSENGQLTIKSSALNYAIIEAEKFEITDEEYKEALKKLCEDNKKTEEELYEEFTEATIKSYIEENILIEKASEFILNNNSCIDKK